MKKITLFLAFIISISYGKAQPVNDDCAGAITLTPGAVCTLVTGNVSGATQSLAGCSGNANDDVWYSFTTTAVAGQNYTITVTGSATFDPVFQVYSASCGGTSITCVNANGIGNIETTTLAALTPSTTYWIRVYDAGAGYPATTTFTICLTTPLAATVTTTPEFCFNSCTGTATGYVTGGVGPFGYSWAGPGAYTGTGSNITALCPGTYTLTVTDSSNMSTATAMGGVGAASAITPTLPASSSICSGACFTITGTVFGGSPPYTYIWTPSAGLNFPTTMNPVTCPTATTTYTLTVTDANGCVGTAVTTVIVNPLDDASFSYSTNVYCNSGANPTPTITGVPGGVFSSTIGLVFVNSSTGQIDLAMSTPGTYIITYTTPGAGGCPNSSTFNLTIINQPIGTFSYIGTPYCQGSIDPSPTFTGGGVAGTFTSSPVGLVISSLTGIVSINMSVPGTYTVTNTIAAFGGCPAVNATSTITINFGGTVNIGPDVTLPCGASTYTLSTNVVPQAISYNWTVGIGETITSGQGTNTITVSIVSGFGSSWMQNTVTAMGPLVCPTYTSDTMYLSVGTQAINFNIMPDSTNAFNYTMFNATYGGGLTYAWDFGDGAVSTLVSPSHTYAIAGIYNVCLTAANGACSGTVCQTLNVTGTLTTCNALFNVAHDTTSLNPNAYTITDLSYGSNLSYLWDFGDMTTSTVQHPVHNYLGAGPYQLCLTVDNGAGCTSTYCDSLFAVDSLHTHLQPIALTVVGNPGQGTTVGVGELGIRNEELGIYPNPTSGIFQISNFKFQISDLKVMNVLGEVVISHWSLVNNKSVTIDLTGVAKGIYFLKIIDENKNVINKKIVLQ